MLTIFSVRGEAKMHRYALALDLGLGQSSVEDTRLWTALSGQWRMGRRAQWETGLRLGYHSVLSDSRTFSALSELRHNFYVNSEVSVFPYLNLQSENFAGRKTWLGLGAGASIRLEPFELELLSWMSLNKQNNFRQFALETRVSVPLSGGGREKDLFGISGSFRDYEESQLSQGIVALFFAQRF
ncbi:hypothetical protein GW916_15165 [bacterium]|nr:hypothetical protein [bacterium]